MAASTWWRVPCPSRDGSKWPLNLPRAQDPSGIVSKMDIFWIRCPLIDRRRAASYSKIGRSHFFFGLLCSLSFLILRLLLLMSGGVHPG